MVTCSNGHRFPVNREKHQDRGYRLCPVKGCGAKVKLKTFIFHPSVNWPRVKEEREQDRRMMKERKKQSRHPSHEPVVQEFAARVSMETVLHAAVELSRMEKQKKIEESEK